MQAPQPPDPATRVLSDVLDGATGQADDGIVRDVYRARHPATVSVMERPHEYRVSYTLGDIHRLTFLSHEERTALRAEWHAWHRRYVRLSAPAYAAWLLGAAVVWGCWFRAGEVATLLSEPAGVAVPVALLQVLGAVVALALLVTLPGFLAASSASVLADAYINGYADGVTRGVNRALRISPEIEQAMWDELRTAERIDRTLNQPANPDHPPLRAPSTR